MAIPPGQTTLLSTKTFRLLPSKSAEKILAFLPVVERYILPNRGSTTMSLKLVLDDDNPSPLPDEVNKAGRTTASARLSK